MGVQTMVSNDTPPTGRKGITINSTYKQVGYNRFKNIIFNSFENGIQLEGVLRLHDNHFENLVFENTIVGVEFLADTAAYDNLFNNLTIQTDSYSKNLIKNITGRHNGFTFLNHNDWNVSHTNRDKLNVCFITIAATAEHTIIQKSEVGNQGWTATNPDSNTIPHPIYLTNHGKYTQLINNFGANGDVIYKFGNAKNPNNALATSNTEILGKIKIAGNDKTNNLPTAAVGNVLVCDAF